MTRGFEGMLAELKREIRLHGPDYVAEQQVNFAATPSWTEGGFRAKPFAVRFYVALADGQYHVMPGGIALDVGPMRGVALHSPAGYSRDVWVLTDEKLPEHLVADAMPEDNFSYKSTPAQRSYGEQILHVASVNLTVLKNVGTAQPPPINLNVTSKAEIVKVLGDSFDYGTALIDQQTNQSMLQKVKTPFHVGDSTRGRVFNLLIGHTWDIYGQMAVYLRLNGITPPASQRP